MKANNANLFYWMNGTKQIEETYQYDVWLSNSTKNPDLDS